MDRLTRVLLSLFGLGFLPIAPGTWGTAGAAAIAFLLPAEGWPLFAAAVFLAASAVTVALGHRAEHIAGGKDPGFVVTDEVAGYLVTVAALAKPGVGWLVIGFFVFRVLDIWKPWPGRCLEKLPAGWGVLLDDVVVGLYGLGLMIGLKHLTGWSGTF